MLSKIGGDQVSNYSLKQIYRDVVFDLSSLVSYEKIITNILALQLSLKFA